jgi:hypothetical protein
VAKLGIDWGMFQVYESRELVTLSVTIVSQGQWMFCDERTGNNISDGQSVSSSSLHQRKSDRSGICRVGSPLDGVGASSSNGIDGG